MKWTQPRPVLRTRLPELDVIADDANDVRLLLQDVREITGIGHELEQISPKELSGRKRMN